MCLNHKKHIWNEVWKIEKVSGIPAENISKLQRLERNYVLKELRMSGLTIGQLQRATGISRGIM